MPPEIHDVAARTFVCGGSALKHRTRAERSCATTFCSPRAATASIVGLLEFAGCFGARLRVRGLCTEHRKGLHARLHGKEMHRVRVKQIPSACGLVTAVFVHEAVRPQPEFSTAKINPIQSHSDSNIDTVSDHVVVCLFLEILLRRCTVHDLTALREARTPPGMSSIAAGQYLCQICLNCKNIRDRVFLINCGHSFCRSCMRMFVESAVLEVRTTASGGQRMGSVRYS
jgi:hypothetical protein